MLGTGLELVDLALELLDAAFKLSDSLALALKVQANSPNLVLVVVLGPLLLELHLLDAGLVFSGKLVRHLDEAALVLELLLIALLRPRKGLLLLLDLDERLLGLGLGSLQPLSQLLLASLHRLDVGLGLLVLALQLSNAGALLLPELERLVGLRLELVLEPLAAAPGEV